MANCDTLKELACFGLVEVARPDVEKFETKSFRAEVEEFLNHMVETLGIIL